MQFEINKFAFFCEFERKTKELKERKKERTFFLHALFNLQVFERLTETQINKWINKKNCV